MKLPMVFFEKDFSLFPPLVKQKVIPIAGFVALIIGIVLTITNWRKAPETASVFQQPATTNKPTSSNLNATLPAITPSPVARINNSNAVEAYVSPITPPPQIINTDEDDPTPSPAPTVATVRYETGTNLDPPSRVGGRAWLRISNGTSSDAIAKLVDSNSGKTVRRVYIRAGDVTRLERVASGYYVLKFSLGSGYDKDSGRFVSSQSFSKFDEILDFTVQRNGDSLEWYNHEVTLNPVPGGTARTTRISAEDFEDH